MNHDDTNLNPNPEMQAWIEPELEARVVAWVAGEASAFEIAELERLVAEKPELAIFKRRIEAVHGLVREAARPDPQPLRLSEERRAKLLATIGAPGAAVTDEKIEVMPQTKRSSRWSWRGPQMYFAASGLAAAALIVIVIAPGQFAEYKEATAVKLAVHEAVRSSAGEDTMRASVDDAPGRAYAPTRPQVTGPAGPAVLSESLEAPLRTAAARSGKALDALEVAKAREASVVAEARARQSQSAGDAIVKLDAFTVSEPRDGSATAISAARSRPLITVPGITVDAELKDKKALFEANAPVAAPAAPVGAFDQSGHNRVTVGGAGGTALRSDSDAVSSPRSDGMRVFSDSPSPNLSKPLGGALLKASDSFGLPLGKVTGATESDQLQRANPFDPAAVAALGNKNPSSGLEFDERIRIGRIETSVAPGSPPPTSTFGSRLNETSKAKAAAGADGTIVLGAATVGGALSGTLPVAPPPAEGPIKLEAFTVSSEKKGAARAIDSVAGPVIALAKRSGAKEEQEKQLREAAQSRSQVSSGNDEINATREAVSTFSLHVSDVSFRLAVASIAALERGEQSKSVTVRPEEFYNAFDYGDAATAVSEKISARIEQSAHPVLQQRNLLRIALKVPAAGRGASQPLRLTVLLDTSGSMEREDRRLAVRRALEELIALLGPNDRVTLIGFARQPRLLAENVAGNQAGHLVALSAQTPAEGGTNLEEAVKLATQLALRHKLQSAQNRIVLLTDGAANLGDADPVGLAKLVETLRQQGIAFDACGIGLEGIGDVVLEALTRKGDGRYYVVDRPEAADAAFARQLAGAFRPAAENVKLQVRFNPARVGNYRLVGFEQHRLAEADFRNDKVDAAELAADEGANAIYQVEVLPQGTGEVGEVFVRFRDPSTGTMVERSWTIRYDPQAPRFDRATPSMQLAGIAALVTEKLNDTPMSFQFKLGDFASVMTAVRAHYSHAPRVQELVTMFGRMRRISGE